MRMLRKFEPKTLEKRTFMFIIALTSDPPPPVCVCSPVVQPAPLSAGNTKSSYKDTFRKERVILWLQPATNPVCSGSSTETEQIRKISVHIFLDSKGCYLENE